MLPKSHVLMSDLTTPILDSKKMKEQILKHIISILNYTTRIHYSIHLNLTKIK